MKRPRICVNNSSHKKTFVTLWLTYASFYLCRVNLSIAIPKITEDLGFSLKEMGLLGSVFSIIYAVGQTINGISAGKRSPRKIIITGIIGSAIINILFGMSNIFWLMLVFWGINAYFQSAGWSPSVKIVSNWFSEKKTGTISGLFGASYHFGNALSWFITGSIALLFSWRALFIIPALLFLLSGFNFMFFVRDHPEEESILKAERIQTQEGDTYTGDLLELIKDPKILQTGMASMFLSVMSYGFLYWIPTYLYKERAMSLSVASFNALFFPLAGALGAVVSGWLSDRFFGSKRRPVIYIMLTCAILFNLLFSYISSLNHIFIISILFLLGFMVYGPHILFGMTFAIDHGKEKASAVAGFLNSLNYFGNATGIFVAGLLLSKWGWRSVFLFWTCSLILSIFIISLKGRQTKKI